MCSISFPYFDHFNPGTNSNEVLNGIAFDKSSGGFWITGKNWTHIYLIEISNQETPSEIKETSGLNRSSEIFTISIMLLLPLLVFFRNKNKPETPNFKDSSRRNHHARRRRCWGMDLEYFLEDISEESSTRIAGAILIIAGSLLGVLLGLLLVSSNPSQIMDETLDSSEDYSDVSGIVISGLSGNDSGGDPVEGVRVRLLSVEGASTEGRRPLILMVGFH